jgi:hypothetical protein
MSGLSDISSTNRFVRLVTTSATLFADSGDYDTCTRLILLALELNDRMFADNGVMIDYLVTAGCHSMVMSAIQHVASRSRFPVEDCQRILSALTPSPKSDSFAGTMVRIEFQRFTLKLLPMDPRAGTWKQTNPDLFYGDNVDEPPFAGNYDAIETAKTIGQVCFALMQNVERPLSQCDRSVYAVVDRDAKDLPLLPDPEKFRGFGKWWGNLKYRFLMNNTSNSVGRAYCANPMWDDTLVKTSCRWRSAREVTRVLLASRIYRSAHGGKLPESVTGFLSLLGEWPQDPYNGKQMIYRQAQEKVYSIGEDLVDDGGDIGARFGRGKDMGLTLKRDIPDPVTPGRPVMPVGTSD